VEAYEAIVTRRSVPKVKPDEVPDRTTIEKLLEAAVRAPNHHLTQPWRFVVLAGDARREFGDAWAAGDQAAGKNPELSRIKAMRAPVVISVIGKPNPDHPKVIEVEEHHAIGAALQNMLLAAHALGLGAMLRTGIVTGYDEVRGFLGLDQTEYVAGFVYVGYPAEETNERPLTRRDAAETRTEWRGWP
jgi:nitroreductase